MSDKEEFKKWWGEAPMELNPLRPRSQEEELSMWVWQAWQAATKVACEACANVCEEVAKPYQAAGASVALECADAIRTRSNV